VVSDVAEAWITSERAYEVYGVRVDADGRVDEAATTARRQELGDVFEDRLR
jgi:hypothetical protein